MKLKITLKDPDGIGNAIIDFAATQVAAIDGISEEEKEMLEETRKEQVSKALRPWIDCDEYLTVEFDTEANTATVLKSK